jgi:hypothetical protein
MRGEEAGFLGATPWIDADHPEIRSTAERLTRGLATPRERAVAVHDFVRDEIDYEFGSRFYEHAASEVLRSGRGYCVTKTTLFVALLRAAGVPARQRFVEIHPGILDGIVDPGTPWMDHSHAEVWLGGAWIPVDSYNVDPALFHAARRRLEAEGRRFGYGIHREGRLAWDGREPSFSQYVDGAARGEIGRRDFGVHADVAAFYAAVPEAWNRMEPGMRTFFRFAKPSFNGRIQSLRAEGRAGEGGGKPGLRKALRGR